MAEASNSERVLVTGATGFVATHIIKQLHEKGYKVRGTVRSLSNESKIKHIKELFPDGAVELVETDLTKEDGWASAVEGCTYVIHTASPLPVGSPADENELITPAVEGVKNVMKAVKDAKCVKRVVLTSAGLAIIGFMKGGEFSEKDWPENDDELEAYAKSKTKAEKEAWEFVKNLEDGDKFELAVIHPTAVLGPVLHSQMGTSMEIMKRILTKNPPLIPKLNIPAVDVRDVAKAHLVAMTEPEAAGHRHIVSTDNIWWSEMAAYVAEEFKPQGYKIASVPCPKVGIQLAAIFDKDVKAILPNWNTVTKLDNSRMKEVLKIDNPIDLKTSVIDMAYSMIEGGFVKKTSKYRGRNWKEIFEQEKAEKEKQRAEKEQAKAEKIAAKRASKKVKATTPTTGNGGVKENGADEGKKDEEKKDEEKKDEEKKDEEKKDETKQEEKKEESEEKKEAKEKDEAEDQKPEEKAEESKAATSEDKEEAEKEEPAEGKEQTEQTAAEEETPPAEKEPTPAEAEPTPAEAEPTPAEAERTPAEAKPTPAEEIAPAEEETTPADEKKETAAEENVSQEEVKEPVEEDKATAADAEGDS